jgi:S1-C subfamily serine protease
VEDLDDERLGARVGSVAPGGPAAVAGLRSGDIVARIDGKTVKDSRVMQRLVVEANVGRILNFDLSRAGKPLAMAVRVARRREASQ